MTATSPRAEFRVVSPSAIAGDWRRVFYLSSLLAWTDLKVRFFDSALGYLWSLMRPLLFFGVLYAVFSEIVRIGSGIQYYPAVLLSGIVLYTFFSESTNDAVQSVLKHEALVRKVAFPRLVIPLSGTLIAGFNLLMNLLAALFFMVLSGVVPRASWLELPALLALLMALALGVSMLLSVLYVRFRDIDPIWQVVTQALFYATPILYPVEVIAARYPKLAQLAMWNPLAAIIQQFRHAVIDPTAPSAAAAIGGTVWLLIPLGIVFGLLALGWVTFNRMSPKVAEQL
jgi:ABC-2 type transport system permease protein